MTPMRGKAITLGISACLTGERVRYDATHKLDPFLAGTLGRFVHYVPVCPEAGCGLGVPREPMRLEGDAAAPRLVTIESRHEMTGRLTAWGEKCLKELEKEDLWGFVFKSRSPSCAIKGVNAFNGEPMQARRSIGLFARLFTERFPWHPVEDEEGLHDPEAREHFIDRIFALKRWRDAYAGKRERQGLVDFHRRHKLFILSHSPLHYREMGRLTARAGDFTAKELYDRYGLLFNEALRFKATRRKHTNVLHHILGYFKKSLSADDKQELLDLFASYREGYAPLIVPITCFNHYLRLYDQPYLREQVYLNPHPLEVQLRNHA